MDEAEAIAADWAAPALVTSAAADAAEFAFESAAPTAAAFPFPSAAADDAAFTFASALSEAVTTVSTVSVLFAEEGSMSTPETVAVF